MIDLSTERVVTLSEATRHVPGRGGKRPNVCTIYRWGDRGLNGVRLETLQVGGTKCTSIEALQRFCERLTSTGVIHGRRPKHRERAIAQAEAELAAAGI